MPDRLLILEVIRQVVCDKSTQAILKGCCFWICISFFCEGNCNHRESFNHWVECVGFHLFALQFNLLNCILLPTFPVHLIALDKCQTRQGSDAVCHIWAISQFGDFVLRVFRHSMCHFANKYFASLTCNWAAFCSEGAIVWFNAIVVSGFQREAMQWFLMGFNFYRRMGTRSSFIVRWEKAADDCWERMGRLHPCLRDVESLPVFLMWSILDLSLCVLKWWEIHLIQKSIEDNTHGRHFTANVGQHLHPHGGLHQM